MSALKLLPNISRRLKISSGFCFSRPPSSFLRSAWTPRIEGSCPPSRNAAATWSTTMSCSLEPSSSRYVRTVIRIVFPPVGGDMQGLGRGTDFARKSAMQRSASLSVVLLLGLFCLSGTGCSTTPATAKPQLALVGQDREIQMGREAYQQVSQ